MGDTDPRHKSRKTEYEVKPQYEELFKQLTCNMLRWKSSGPVSPSQLGGRHSNGSHHSDDSVGLFGHDSTIGQSQRGTQSASIYLNRFHKQRPATKSSLRPLKLHGKAQPKSWKLKSVQAGHPIATLKTQRFNLSKRRHTAYVTLSVARYLATGSSNHRMVAPSNATAEISSQHSKMLTNTCRSFVDPCISAPAASSNHSKHNYYQQITMHHAYVISTDTKFTRLELHLFHFELSPSISFEFIFFKSVDFHGFGVTQSVDSVLTNLETKEPWLPDQTELGSLSLPWYEEKSSNLRLSDISLIKEKGRMLDKIEVVLSHRILSSHINSRWMW
ncbi:hypothetical protein F511_37001 [Dorcoceras hygrometricum]|uniref:Uncharacterized protein n=1 Tax=Dorcoceras hygrometricum TaxID=472368 RepID=A0A2Z7AZJ0_9LAMI|nr:hypothetical protein F511_37001 [Dorcoceras hygrometricum]